MGGKASRDKGHNYERALANDLKPIYPDAKRGLRQVRDGGEDCDVEGTPYWIEAKKRKTVSIKAAIRQAVRETDGRPILVITKEDRQDAYVTLKYDDWKKMINDKPKNSCYDCDIKTDELETLIERWR